MCITCRPIILNIWAGHWPMSNKVVVRINLKQAIITSPFQNKNARGNIIKHGAKTNISPTQPRNRSKIGVDMIIQLVRYNQRIEKDDWWSGRQYHTN